MPLDTHLSPQCQAILAELQRGPITTMQVIRRCGVICVSARMHELKEAGYPISMRMVSMRDRRRTIVHVGEYSLTRRRRQQRAA